MASKTDLQNPRSKKSMENIKRTSDGKTKVNKHNVWDSMKMVENGKFILGNLEKLNELLLMIPNLMTIFDLKFPSLYLSEDEYYPDENYEDLAVYKEEYEQLTGEIPPTEDNNYVDNIRFVNQIIGRIKVLMKKSIEELPTKTIGNIAEKEVLYKDFSKFVFNKFSKVLIPSLVNVLNTIHYFGFEYYISDVQHNFLQSILKEIKIFKTFDPTFINGTQIAFYEAIHDIRIRNIVNNIENSIDIANVFKLETNEDIGINQKYYRSNDTYKSEDSCIYFLYEKKTKGNASIGFIINIEYDGVEMKQQFLFAKQFYINSYRLKSPNTEGNLLSNKTLSSLSEQNGSSSEQSTNQNDDSTKGKLRSSCSSEKKITTSVVHNICVEFFGYFFLNMLGLAPEFTVIHSNFFNEPFIVMEKIPDGFEFISSKDPLADPTVLPEFCTNVLHP